MPEYQLSEENADSQLSMLLEYYEIEIEDFDNESLQSALMTARKKLIKAIRTGVVEIKDEEGVPIVYQHLKKAPSGVKENTIRYKEVDGMSKIAMKDVKDTDYHGRLYAFLGGLSGESATIIKKLKSTDLSTAECIGTIFLQV
jgi:hypothetical protein